MKDKAIHCRKRAQECLRRAEESASDHDKLKWAQLAEAWLMLAKQA